MTSYRSWLDPSGRTLARRLDQLRVTLDNLGSRLRAAVSTAVGETVGVVVRDALNHVLDRMTGYRSASEPLPVRSRTWPEDEEEGIWPDDDWVDHEPELADRTVQPEETQSDRVALCVSAGLSAAAWWLRRWTGRLGVVSTAVVGLIATYTMYSVPALATVGAGLINSAGQLAFLSDSAKSLAST
jgi:hypothetical protein